MQNSKRVFGLCLWVTALTFAPRLGLHLRPPVKPTQGLVIEGNVIDRYPSRLETKKTEQPPVKPKQPAKVRQPQRTVLTRKPPERKRTETIGEYKRLRPLVPCSSPKADRSAIFRPDLKGPWLCEEKGPIRRLGKPGEVDIP
jgi:hypothetical protein